MSLTNEQIIEAISQKIVQTPWFAPPHRVVTAPLLAPTQSAANNGKRPVARATSHQPVA